MNIRKLLIVSLLVAPLLVSAAPGSTPPWTTSVAETPNALAICKSQGGAGEETCIRKDTEGGTKSLYSPLVNGQCPETDTVKSVRCKATGQPPPTSTDPSAGSDANCKNGFCSLTNIQNVEFAGNAADLPNFLNAIYMICIGLAAVIGVLQIMRAGVTWMTAAGSHEKIGEAKNLVRDTIIGLVLVLAPTIVFSIINPEILSLKINRLGDLQTNLPTPNRGVEVGGGKEEVELDDLGNEVDRSKDAIAPPPAAPGCDATIRNRDILPNDNKSRACCTSQTNKYVKCELQARSGTKTDKFATVEFCGCSIQPNLGMEYYDLYSAPFYQVVGKLRYETDLVKEGTTPAGTAAKFNDFKAGCEAVNGEFEAKSTRNILQSKYIQCPADAGAPASNEERVYRCMPMKATCTNK